MSDYLDTRLLVGNCLDKLKELADDSIDSIVTDPPYELGFMGKSWDSTGIAFNVDIWQECIRVLKPGGHLLAFSGSRTYHRMAVAIEDAGFEIRDQIMWLYGSGFPKSLNVAKSMQAKKTTGKASPKGQRLAAMGTEYEATPLAGTPGYGTTGNFVNKDTGGKELVITDTTAKQWQGWGTALKPAHEPIVVARKPLIGTVAETVLKYGTGGINIDASRVGTVGGTKHIDGEKEYNNEIYGKGLYKDFGKPVENLGRFPANVILTHNHDCQETNNNNWSCTPGCPATQFPSSKGALAPVKSGQKGFGGEIYNKYKTSGDDGATFYNDGEGSAARFFYCAKASKKERNAGLDGLTGKSIGAKGNGLARVCDKCSTPQLQGCECIDNSYINPTRQNFHPTVKPIELMKYLIKLVTPPKGTVLDPFLGSGTTAVAAVLEGFEWKGCEMTDDYLPIIKARVSWAKKQVKKTVKQEELEL